MPFLWPHPSQGSPAGGAGLRFRLPATGIWEIGCRWDGLCVQAREREGRQAAWLSPGLWSFLSTGPDAVGYTAHSIPPFPGVGAVPSGRLVTSAYWASAAPVTHNLGQGQAVLSALLGSWGCPLAEGWAPAFGYRFLPFMLGSLSSLPPWAGDAFLHGASSRPRELSWQPLPWDSDRSGWAERKFGGPSWDQTLILSMV